MGLRQCLKTTLGSTHVVEQLLFSLFPSILKFDFDLILGLFLTFLGPNWLFLNSMWGSKTVLGYTHVVEQLLFSMVPSILTFDLYLILGSFLTFWGPNEVFWGWGRFRQLFWGLLMLLNNFYFLCFFQFFLGGWWWFPSDYLVSTQLQLWLFCCWGCGCCWAVTI